MRECEKCKNDIISKPNYQVVSGGTIYKMCEVCLEPYEEQVTMSIQSASGIKFPVLVNNYYGGHTLFRVDNLGEKSIKLQSGLKYYTVKADEYIVIDVPQGKSVIAEADMDYKIEILHINERLIGADGQPLIV